jgi:hypothetical protein
MNRRMLGLALSFASASACGGNAIELERQPRLDPSVAGASGAIASDSAQVDHRIASLIADDSSVYWVADFKTSSKVQGCTFERCGATVSTYVDASSSIVATTSDLFFSSQPAMDAVGVERQTILRCAKAGCNGAPTEFVHDPDGGSEYTGVAFNADADAFYWASKFDIYRCPSSGCGEVPERVAARSGDDPSLAGPKGFGGITVDLLLSEESVYWVVSADDLAIYSAAKDGSREAARVATLPQPDWGIAVDGQRLYWVDTSHHIVSCPLAHCTDSPPTALVTTETRKTDLRVDERGIYWLDTGYDSPRTESAINFCSLSGCAPDSAPRILSSKRVESYTSSPSYVFWTESPTSASSDGGVSTIYRVPKPAP